MFLAPQPLAFLVAVSMNQWVRLIVTAINSAGDDRHCLIICQIGLRVHLQAHGVFMVAGHLVHEAAGVLTFDLYIHQVTDPLCLLHIDIRFDATYRSRLVAGAARVAGSLRPF